MKNKSKKNQLLFVKNTLTELTPGSLQEINGGEIEGTTRPPWPPVITSAQTGIKDGIY